MKTKLLSITYLFLFGFIKSYASIVNVDVKTSGTLQTLLGSDIETIDSIKLSGNLNTNDMLVLKKMTVSYKLVYIDLYDASAPIGSNAFEGSYGIKHIILPQNCTSIGYLAFAHCSNLEKIILGKKVQYLDNGCLRGCEKLEEIVLPKTVRHIGTQCFDGGTRFNDIYCEGSNPPSASTNAWGYFGSVVHVPIGSKSAYQFANGWMNFENIVEYQVANTHSLSCEIVGEGRIYLNGNLITGGAISVDNDENALLYLEPIEGWVIKKVEVNGKDITSDLNENELLLEPTENDVVVTVIFERYFDVGNLTKVVDFIMNSSASAEDVALYDLNNNEKLDIGDVILIVKFILNNSNDTPNSISRRIGEVTDLSQYTAAQFQVKTAGNVDLRLVKSMEQTHQLMYQQKDANTYAVVVYSLSNQLMQPENGKIIETDNNSDILSIENVTVATPTGETAYYQTLSATTGIEQIESENGNGTAVIYDLKGNRLNNSKALNKGIYIVNGKKAVVR